MPCQDDPFPEMLHIGNYFHKSVVFLFIKSSQIFSMVAVYCRYANFSIKYGGET